MSLCLEISVHRRRLVAGMTPESNTPSKDADDHQNQGQQDPLRCRSSSRPQEGHQGKLWRDGLIVFRVDLDDVGDGVAPYELFPLLSRSV